MPTAWSHDFGRIPIHSHQAQSSPPELAVNRPGDRCEQEADNISEQVIGMPGGAVRLAPQPGLLPAQPIEGDSLAQEPASHIAGVLRAPGVLLDTRTRAFMEQRFGHDFSQVRIHSRCDDAAAAQSLGAAAFTLGSDIFFNSGQYRPESAAGLGLLAHELAHVIQQQSGGQPNRVIQRALIDYRSITWADFAAKPPATIGPEGAGITSRFGPDPLPSFSSPHADVKASKKPCGKPRDRLTETTVTYTADPADIGKIKAVMDPDQSWALARYTGNGTDYCNVKAEKCRRELAGGGTLTSPGGATISTPGECFPVCMREETAERARLLRHEQGHFNITNAMATKARDDLNALNATLSAAKTGCGEQAARDAARPDYESKVRDVLAQRLRDWSKLREDTQTAYDAETTHGSDKAKQAGWETEIKGGLKKLQLPALPATPPSSTAPPAQAPATTPPANPPAQTPQKPPEKTKTPK